MEVGGLVTASIQIQCSLQSSINVVEKIYRKSTDAPVEFCPVEGGDLMTHGNAGFRETCCDAWKCNNGGLALGL